MTAKEMIKWLEDVLSDYEEDNVISMSYSTIEAIIETLQDYEQEGEKDPWR